ncbi:paralemmin-1 isoform X2 [Pelodiscus sinensis]|uniref:paralemmin-1 isoform X2 n=1 Tax=Pelodiscus sinensis TaxID=13735 RepID=UPI003F6A808C
MQANGAFVAAARALGSCRRHCPRGVPPVRGSGGPGAPQPDPSCPGQPRAAGDPCGGQRRDRPAGASAGVRLHCSREAASSLGAGAASGARSGCLRLAEASAGQQERLQAIAEKRKRQTEIENKRRQLEDDRRQLQHLKSKALREKWLLEGAPSSASEEDEAMKKQMQEDEAKSKELEESIQRLEKELESLENGDLAPSTKETLGEMAEEEQKAANAQKTPLGTAKAERPISNSPMKSVEGSSLMKAVVHAVHMEDGAIENGVHALSSSEVDELIHKADEKTLSEIAEWDSKSEEAKKGGPEGSLPSQKSTPRKEITGVQAKPMDSPKILASGEGPEPSQEQPVTMIFMGYQHVEDENETKKVLGLGGTITAELVVIEDAESKPAADCPGKEHAPPNGSTVEPAGALPLKEDSQAGEKPGANDTEPKGADQDLDMKKQRCKCCTVM